MKIDYDKETRIRRGKAAARIRGDDMVQEVLAGIRQDLHHQFETSTSAEQREAIYGTLQGLRRIEDGLLEIENAGKLADLPPKASL